MRGKLVDGESVLIHAGAGAVGLAAIHVALSKKCRVFTTVGSKDKLEFITKEFPQVVNDFEFTELLVRKLMIIAFVIADS